MAREIATLDEILARGGRQIATLDEIMAGTAGVQPTAPVQPATPPAPQLSTVDPPDPSLVLGPQNLPGAPMWTETPNPQAPLGPELWPQQPMAQGPQDLVGDRLRQAAATALTQPLAENEHYAYVPVPRDALPEIQQILDQQRDWFTDQPGADRFGGYPFDVVLDVGDPEMVGVKASWLRAQARHWAERRQMEFPGLTPEQQHEWSQQNQMPFDPAGIVTGEMAAAGTPPAGLDPELGLYDEAARGVMRGGLNIAESVPFGMDLAGSGLQQMYPGQAGQQAQQMLRGGAAGMREGLGEARDVLRPSGSAAGFEPGNWRWWAGGLSEQLPQLLLSMTGMGAAGQIGRAAGLGDRGLLALRYLTATGLAGSQEGGHAYRETLEELQSQGITGQQAHDTAALVGVGVGLVSGVLDAIGADEVMRVRLGQSMFREFLADASAEGSTEFLQELAQEVGVALATGREIDPEAPMAGFLLGAGTGGGVGAVRNLYERALAREMGEQDQTTGQPPLREMMPGLDADGQPTFLPADRMPQPSGMEQMLGQLEQTAGPPTPPPPGGLTGQPPGPTRIAGLGGAAPGTTLPPQSFSGWAQPQLPQSFTGQPPGPTAMQGPLGEPAAPGQFMPEPALPAPGTAPEPGVQQRGGSRVQPPATEQTQQRGGDGDGLRDQAQAPRRPEGPVRETGRDRPAPTPPAPAPPLGQVGEQFVMPGTEQDVARLEQAEREARMLRQYQPNLSDEQAAHLVGRMRQYAREGVEQGLKGEGVTEHVWENLADEWFQIAGQDTYAPSELMAEIATEALQSPAQDAPAAPETQQEFRPKDGWRENLFKAREYANALNIPHKGKGLKQLLAEIDQHLGQAAPAPRTTKPTPDQAQATFMQFKRRLTRALNAKDWQAVIREADAFDKHYTEHGGWPDDWARWERARDEAVLALQRESDTTGLHRPPPAPAGQQAAAGQSLKVGDRIPWKNSPDPNEDIREIEIVALTKTTATVRWVGGEGLQKLPRAAVEKRIADAATPTPPPAAQAPAGKAFGADNRVVTRDRYEELKKRWQKKMNELRAGFDPELLAIAAEMGAFHVEAGARKFADFARSIVSDVGEGMRPYLKAAYLAARNMPGMEQARAEMDSADTVEGLSDADLDAILAQDSQEGGIIEQEASDAADTVPGPTVLPPGTGQQGQPEAGAVGPAGAGSLDAAPAEDGGAAAEGGGASGRGDSGPGTREGRVRDDGEPGVRSDGGQGDRPGPVHPPGKRGGDRGGEGPAPDAGAAKRVRGSNYVISDPAALNTGGLKAKFRDNVAAIELLRKIEAEGRQATAEEQAILARYIGWGAMPGAFNVGGEAGQWTTERDILRDLLSKEEFEAARRSTLNAHYTAGQIVQAMWRMAGRLGFDGGRVLEPAVGSGNFFGLIPQPLRGSQLTGVELDSLTGRIARLLYPKANVQIKGFQDLRVPDGFFDLVVSNFPFGDYRIHDKRYNRFTAPIHDYFFLKSVDKVREGGIVLAITSTGTMDKQSPRVREALAKQADLVAAIRLPAKTFAGNAGTDVVTDIIILRKRAEGEQPSGPAWMEVRTVPDPDGGQPIPVNEYFVDHPQQVLGRLDRKGTMYRGDSVNVSRTEDFEQRLERVIERLPEKIMTPRQAEPQAAPRPAEEAGATKDGGFTVQGKGKMRRVYRRQGDELVPVEMEAKQAAIVADILQVRDALREVFAAQLADRDAGPARAKLNEVYDAFVKRHGPLNKRENARAFAQDPDAPVVQAIEKYDPKTGAAEKADVFRRNTVRGYAKPTRAGSASEAVGISLNETGGINLERIAELLNRPADAVGEEMVAKGLAFNDPAGGWKSAEQYLSGNVRRKLVEAREAAAADPKYRPNVEALERVQPADVEYDQISVRLGVPWVPVSDIQQFAADLLGGIAEHFSIAYLPTTGAWMTSYSPSGLTRHQASAQATQIYGTDRVNFIDLLEDALNNKQQRLVYDGSGDDRTLNKDATAAATAKIKELHAHFREWVWEDDARRQRLHRHYNDNYNNIRLVEYDGSHLALPGMDPWWGEHLRPHQRNAVWRIISTGKALLAHEVGTGKTATMVAAAMELRRLGLSSKPMISVPKARLHDTVKEAREIYPNIRVLGIESFEGPKRRQLVSRIATGDWDLVVMSHEHMNYLPMSPEVEVGFIQREMEELESVLMDAYHAAGGKKRRSSENRVVKALEKAKERLRERLQKALDAKKDNAVTFEETGIDFVFVDEAHKYKSLPVYTKQDRVKGIPTSKSDRAVNLWMRAQWLQQMHNGRGMVFATGTPITNTMAEMYVMQRYLQFEDLRERGLTAFDAWAATFGEVSGRMEYKTTGEYELVARLAEFVNLDELTSIARQMMDVQRVENLPDFKRPRRVDRVLAAPMSEGQQAYLAQIRARAQAIKGQPPGEKGADNMLKISSDARKMSIDMRLVDATAEDHPENKVNRVVAEVLRIHRADPQATQMIFSDVGVNKTDWGFSVFGDIIQKLVAGGIPRNRIINFSALTESQKKTASQRLKEGQALVGLGSSETMGTGVNAQDHLAALHHLDVPWIPAFLEQRDGRGWRQGNRHAQIQINRVVTEGSFDTFMWQTVDRKTQFIRQALDGKNQSRNVREEDGEELTPAQVMAITSGNPLLLEKIQVDQDAAELVAAEARHRRQQLKLRDTVASLESRLEKNRERHERMRKDLETAKAHADDDFSITLAGRTITDRDSVEVNSLLLSERAGGAWDSGREIGSYRGFTLKLYVAGFDRRVRVEGEAAYDAGASLGSIEYAVRPSSLQRRLTDTENAIKRDEADLEKVRKQIGKPFRQAEELKKVLARQEQITQDLAAQGQPHHDQGADDNAAPPAGPTSDDFHDGPGPRRGSLGGPVPGRPRRTGVGPAGAADAGGRAGWAATPPETPRGKILANRIKADPEGRKVGPRSIVEFVNDVVRTRMFVGKRQTTKRHPAHYRPVWHIIRTRSGTWHLNFHEAGHALSAVLRDREPGLFKQLRAGLVNLTTAPGSFASSKSSEEGFAEFVRLYIVQPDGLPAEMVKKIEAYLGREHPEVLAGLKDAHRAWVAHKSRSMEAQLRSYSTDGPPRPPALERARDLVHRLIFSAVNGEMGIDRVERKMFRAIRQFSLTHARMWREKIKGTPADMTSAYQFLTHVPQEVTRAVHGADRGPEGLRVLSTGEGFGRLPEEMINALDAAGFDLPANLRPGHGEWIYLHHNSFRKIVQQVGKGNWDGFEIYGQMRAALHRHQKKGHAYPGLTDGFTPDRLQAWLAEQERQHQDWKQRFKDVQKFMDQLLLVTVLSGEHDVATAVRIKNAWEDYWPLPRQVEDRAGKRSGKGTDPTAGIYRAWGSDLPFKSLAEAVEARVKMALESYYQNRMILSVYRAAKQMQTLREVPLHLRAVGLQLMLPLRLESKKVATLNPDETRRIIADHLNRHRAAQLDMPIEELPEEMRIDPNDVEVWGPGFDIWRRRRPTGPTVVAPFDGGERLFFEVTDPILFDMMAQSRSPHAFIRSVERLGMGPVRPWKRLLTQNAIFATWNTVRDSTTSMFMGRSRRWRTMIPGYFFGFGLLNRLTGRDTEAVSQSELLSKALDAVDRKSHQTIVEKFQAVLAEGIVVPDWSKMSTTEKAMELPGVMMNTLVKPIELMLWATGQRALAQFTESVAREGGFLESRARGENLERAQSEYDRVSGNFGQRAGDANAASIWRLGGFFNPYLQIAYGIGQRLTDPDPSVRRWHYVKLGALAMLGGMAAAVNYLMTDEEDREKMRERTEEDRLRFMAIMGRLRVPFDYGITGAMVSFGWNLVEGQLLGERVKGTTMARSMLMRSLDVPGPWDAAQPHLVTMLELQANYSFWLDRPIEPPWMQMAYPQNPELRAMEDTPETYRTIGRWMGVSPVKVQYAVRNLFSNQFDETIQAVELLLAGRSVEDAADLPFVGRLFHREPRGWRSKSVQNLAEKDREYQNLRRLVTQIGEQLDLNEAERKHLRQVEQSMMELERYHQAMRLVDRFWRMAKEERRRPDPDQEEIKKLEREMVKAAREALREATPADPSAEASPAGAARD